MPRELLEFAKHAHDSCGALAMKLRFDQRFHKDGALMCSYATLIEHTGGMIALAEARMRTSSTAVLRSMLEAFVDFQNLFNDRSYFQNMLAKHNGERLRMLQHASKGNNGFLAGIGQLDGLAEKLAECEEHARRFKEKGIIALSVADRFRRAGMEDIHASVYPHLCGGAHNDPGALRRRHALRHEEGYKLHIYRPVELKEFDAELDSAVSYLLTASHMIHEQLNSDELKQIVALIDELNDARAAYID